MAKRCLGAIRLDEEEKVNTNLEVGMESIYREIENVAGVLLYLAFLVLLGWLRYKAFYEDGVKLTNSIRIQQAKLYRNRKA